MMAKPLTPGMKVRIRSSEMRGDGKYLGLTTKVLRQYGKDTYLLYIDGGHSWWPIEFLEVLCCGAKGCMWHKKDNQ